MNILLIQPPIQDFYQTAIRTQPIGLAYLAGSLKACGHGVDILDTQTARKQPIPIPPELAYLQDLYPVEDRSPFRLYTGYTHFGMGWEEIKKRIRASNAEAFGISSSFTPYHQEALEVARIIKSWSSNKIVIMGGAHVSCDPAGVLRSPLVDYVILGEGEIRLPHLLESIERGVVSSLKEADGIGYKMNGEIHIQPLQHFMEDLDHLPPPAREFLDLDRYRIKRVRSTMLITSRGCPHGCTYCSGRLVTGTSFRARCPENILNEMVDCYQRYGIRLFDIEDDNFTYDSPRAKRLMTLILQAFGEGSLELTAMNGVSFASLDEELLVLMKRAGFKTINLSFVSTDPSTKKKMRRPGTGSGFDRVLKEAERVGLNVITYGIFGMPGQTIDEMIDTLVHLMGRRVLIGPSIYYPTPGTPLFEQCRQMGILPPHPIQWRSSAFPIENETFNRLDLVTLFRLTRAINVLKANIDKGKIKEGLTLREIHHGIQAQATVHPNGEEETDGEGPAEGIGEAVQVPEEDGVNHLSFLLEGHSFYSVRKTTGNRRRMARKKSSQRVVDRFLEKAWESTVMGSRNR